MPARQLQATLLVAALAVAQLTATATAWDGRLSRLQRETRNPPRRGGSAAAEPQMREPADDGHDNGYDDDYGDGFFDETLGEWFEYPVQLVALGATSPFWVPPALMNDTYELEGHFARYPYQRGDPGQMNLGEGRSDMRFWMGRLRGEYSDEFGNLSRTGGQLLLDTKWRLGVDSQVDRRREETHKGTFDMWTGDANIVFRFAQSPRGQMRAGAGMNWLAGRSDATFGWNVTYGGDWFPHEPWVLSAELDWGSIGDAGLVHARTTVGLEWHRLELFTGYDYFRLDSEHLDGLVGGVRVWF